MENVRTPAARAGRPLRAGFTLIEVLIVVAILAAIATFVVPELIDRADDGEPARIAADLAGISSGIELFHLDQRTAFPGDLEDLVNLIETTEADIEGTAYATGNVNRWSGPYLTLTMPATVAATDTVISTAFQGAILNGLILYDAAADDPTVVACGPDIWVTTVIDGLSVTDFELANDVIDGETETDGGAAGESQLSGRLRYDGAATPEKTYFLTHPCTG